MTEKFKVLAAMLALEEFTPEEIGRFSGVKTATVRTILSRSTHLIEEIGPVETGHRGGQPMRYRLSSNGREETRQLVEETFEALATPSNAFVGLFQRYFHLNAAQERAGSMPLGISSAQDTLERLLPRATTPEERLELLRIAERQIKSVLQELSESSDRQGLVGVVEEKLREIHEKRAAINERRDEKAVQAIASGKPLVTLSPSAGSLMQPRLQVWSEVGSTTANELVMRIVQALQRRTDILTTAVPLDSGLSEVGDVVILVVNSLSPTAGPDFKRAIAACSASGKPLVVLDENYSPTFRNLVLSAGAADYWNDAAALDPDGILNIAGRAAGFALPERKSALSSRYLATRNQGSDA